MMQKESTDRKEKFAAFAAQMANESYTSGESDEQSNFHVPFNMLPKKDKKKQKREEQQHAQFNFRL